MKPDRPLSLTDRQMLLLRQATGSLPPQARDEFLRSVARHLGSDPTDHAVSAAIDAELSLNRLPVFLSDGKLTKGDHNHD
jgi:hypothetical protein